MTRTHARALRGQRAPDTVPRNRGTVTTILGLLGSSGLVATMTMEGGTTSEAFVAYIKQVLAHKLQPGDVVVMDNLGAHRSKKTRAAFRRLRVQVKYLPPYSPELNPIELCWSKLKAGLRAAKARTREALDQAIAQMMKTITAKDAQGWINHCGYQAHPM